MSSFRFVSVSVSTTGRTVNVVDPSLLVRLSNPVNACWIICAPCAEVNSATRSDGILSSAVCCANDCAIEAASVALSFDAAVTAGD